MAKSEEKNGGKRTSPVNIAKHLQGIDFPVSKQDLIEHAKKKGADDAAMKTSRKWTILNISLSRM